MNTSNKTIKMVGGVAKNPATGDVTGYATLRSLLSNEFGLDPNLRDPVLGDIQKDVMRTLEEDPRHFSQHNGGLMFTARSATFNPETGDLKISMLERAPAARGPGFDDGQADGANSLAAARTLVRRLTDLAADGSSPDDKRLAAEQRLRDVLDHACFRVEVVVDLPADRLPKVCAHRNSNRKQRSTSIVNHEDGFAPLKSALGELAKDVSFYEGDVRPDGGRKSIDVTEVLRLVVAAADRTPAQSYASVGGAPRRYQEATSSGDRRYLAATRNVGGLMTLLDAVDEAASRYVERGSEAQRFTWGVSKPSAGFKPRFGRSPRGGLTYQVPDCFVLPIFSAVARNLMRDDGSWIKDPLSYFQQHKADLLETVFGMFRRSKVGTTRFGKLSDVWDGLRDLVGGQS
jgi:hypothetical protein